MKKIILAIILAAAAATSAGRHANARNVEGRLTFIKRPISTNPEITVPGGEFTIDVATAIYDSCTCPFNVYAISGTTRTAISALSRIDSPASGTYRFVAKLPADLKPGVYEINAHKGVNDDTSRRALFVLDSFPSSYTVLHVTDVHVGRQNHQNYKGAPTLQLEQIIEKSNELKPDLVIISGDNTYTGSADEQKLFIEKLDGFNAPTFVQAGNHDAKQKEAESFLGDSNYSFMFGKDLYISLDTQQEMFLPDKTGRIDWLRKQMTAHPDARMTTLFTHQNDRLESKSFADAVKPGRLDLILSGHIHIEQKRKGGKTLFLTTGAYADGFYRVIKLTDGKVASEKQYHYKINESKYYAGDVKSEKK